MLSEINNFPVKIYDKEYWISRSVACAAMLFCYDSAKEPCVLLVKKTNSGLWSLPCGYLDFNETLGECISREVKEETNLNLEFTDPYKVSDNLSNYNQNIVFYFLKNLRYHQTNVYEQQFKPNDPEISEIKFVRISDLGDYPMAFPNHLVSIGQALNNLK